MGKPFFYKIIAADLAAEVMQIPEGKHKEWLHQFVVDLVSAKGSTAYSSRLISEVQEFRKKQAENGAAGGKKNKKKKESIAKAPLDDPQAPLSDPQAGVTQPQGISSSISTELHPSKDESSSNGGRRTMFLDGMNIYIDTGEEVNPF